MPSRTTIVSLLALVGAATSASCASAPIPTELLAERSERGSGPEPTLHFDVRAGDSWLEVSARNAGPHPAVIDWAGAWFVTADGRRHRLLSVALLTELEMALQQEAWARQGQGVPWHPGAQLVASRERLEAIIHHGPPGEWRTRISAGRHGSVFAYPIEHVRRNGEGYTVDPLFCAPEIADGGHHFILEVPVQSAGRWDTLAVALRTLPRLAASR